MAAGPAILYARPGRTKMPLPIIAPMLMVIVAYNPRSRSSAFVTATVFLVGDIKSGDRVARCPRFSRNSVATKIHVSAERGSFETGRPRAKPSWTRSVDRAMAVFAAEKV